MTPLGRFAPELWDDIAGLVLARNPMSPAPSAPVASPCINVCRMNERSGLCEGCLRTLDEIAQWSQMDEAVKLRVWGLLEQRRQHCAPAIGEAR